jgi:hypothetical protein
MNDRNQSDINSILQNGYSVEIGKFVQRGWEICQSNLGLFIGFFLVTLIIGATLGIIPGAGNGVSIVIGGPLNAGSLIVAFKVIKGQSIDFGDFFKGFQKAYFLPTVLVTLVTALLTLACLVPAGIGFGIASFASSASGEGQANPILLLVATVLAIAGLIGMIYLSISYVFAIPLVVGRKVEFWPAMEASRKVVGQQWFNVFGFMFVLGLINVAGVLACGLGLLVTVPLTTCAIAAAYESIFGLPNTDDSLV